MSQTDALYQEIILEHNRKPRNFREMPDADRTIEGRNPLCGDALTLWMKLNGDTIADVSFKGEGCAISKASASLMTAAVKGKTRAEAEVLFDQFHDLVTGAFGAGPEGTRLLARLRRSVAIPAPREMRESRLARDAFGARRRGTGCHDG